MDVGNVSDWAYLRLCRVPGCQSLHKSRGIAGINSNAPLVSAAGAAEASSYHCSSTCAVSLCRDLTHSFHSFRLSAFLFLCFRNTFTSVMAHITGLLLGWTTKRCIKLEQTWQEMPHLFSSMWGWGHFLGDGPKSLVCNSLALGRVPPHGQHGGG